MEITLWIAILLIIYPYILYPLAIYLLGLIRPRQVRRGQHLPLVTVLIAAYNEADAIARTIQNKLDQNYPADRLQVIVISDASTDGTDAVIRSFGDRVTLLRRDCRSGKAAALNAAVPLATGEILVFSDANSIFSLDALQRIVENFADPEVGYVTGSLSFVRTDSNLSGNGVSAYMRFENLVRKIETKFGSIIGVNGGIDAIRASLYTDTPAHLITDFILPMTVMAKKFRVIYDPSVTAFEVPNSEISSEFRMRIRVALRAMQGLVHMRNLLNPVAHPLESFCLISHKLLRYFGFIFMAGALVFNIVLAMGSPFYQFLLGMQTGMYFLALMGILSLLPASLNSLTTVPSYLVVSNAAFAVATFRFLRGDTMAVWQPRAG